MPSYEELVWSSDWNGDEIGYPELGVVGLYSLKAYPYIYMYIDVENEVILEAWYSEE